MIDILLATYNGDKFLREQIDSILAQSFSNFHLIIRDDGSSDNTHKILNSYVERFPHKITLIPTTENLGVKGNFSALMEHSTAPYVMFADQDDLWHHDKVERSLRKIKSLEGDNPEAILVHTDLTVVDQQLQLLGSSYWKFSGINPSHSSLNRLLVQNMVTGCSIICNKPLIELATPIPQEALMHDWWLALVAAAFGKIDQLNESTLLYRQHAHNMLGAQKFSSLSWLVKGLKKLFQGGKRLTEPQVAAFLARYELILTLQQRTLVVDYLKLTKISWLASRYSVVKHRFFRHGIMRNLIFFSPFHF